VDQWIEGSGQVFTGVSTLREKESEGEKAASCENSQARMPP